MSLEVVYCFRFHILHQSRVHGLVQTTDKSYYQNHFLFSLLQVYVSITLAWIFKLVTLISSLVVYIPQCIYVLDSHNWVETHGTRLDDCCCQTHICKPLCLLIPLWCYLFAWNLLLINLKHYDEISLHISSSLPMSSYLSQIYLI